MYTEYHIKETVTVLTVTKQKQKIRFQIRHPENVYSITGIAVTSNLLPDVVDMGRDLGGVDKGITAGHLALSLPQKGDIVYGDDVRLDDNNYGDFLEREVYQVITDISFAKKRDYYLRSNFKINKAILEGFYEDIYSPDLTNTEGVPKAYLYKIRVYIRYQMKTIEPKEETK
jgi:hypothetical protein